MQERYVRWVLGVEDRTPGYVMREETQREKLRSRMRRRTKGFEDRLGREEGSALARSCLEELGERVLKERELSSWELGRV